VSNASKLLIENLNFSGITGPNALNGIITSKITPSFTMNTLDASYAPHLGKSLFIGGEFAGLGGTVHTIRPIIQYKQFFPMQKRADGRGRNAIGYNVQASFITGYAGIVAPPFERAYLGGENDIRGFDIRTISPIAYLPSAQAVSLRNPDGTFVPANPNFKVQINPSTGACISNCWNIPVPYNQLVTPGGDLSLNGNLEYRITIAGPVAIAPFVDVGVDPIIRTSQLQTNLTQYNTLINTLFGCPTLNSAFACTGGEKISGIPRNLRPVPGTNWVPRMSTGIELQTMLPVVNAPFRIYYAYNALRLDGSATPPIQITRDMFPNNAAGLYTYQTTLSTLGSRYTLREPRKTFRFSVATTF
jgi:outer membrane protein insertion porin family